MLCLALGASFLFWHGRAKCSREKKDLGTLGTCCAVGMWFSSGAVSISIGQCGARLIASRFGSGVKKGNQLRDGTVMTF